MKLRAALLGGVLLGAAAPACAQPALGYQAAPTTPNEHDKILREQIRSFAEIVRRAGSSRIDKATSTGGIG